MGNNFQTLPKRNSFAYQVEKINYTEPLNSTQYDRSNASGLRGFEEPDLSTPLDLLRARQNGFEETDFSTPSDLLEARQNGSAFLKTDLSTC